MYRKREILKQFSGQSPQPDTTPPVINLKGGTFINLVVGTPWSEVGYEAIDDQDGDITGDVVIVNPLDINTVGVYVMTYNVQDSAGNNATQKTRTFDVQAAVDTTIPVITLLGDSETLILQGEPYVDAGATALDDVDGDITGSIVVGGDVVDTSASGVFTITYNVQDSAGNQAEEVTRIVSVFGQIPYAYPPTQDANEVDWGDFVIPTSEPTAYNVPFLDGKTGANIIRIAPDTQTRFSNRYAKEAVWNADDTIMKIPSAGAISGTAFITDNDDGDYTNINYIGVEGGGFWSNVDPTLLYVIFRYNGADVALKKQVYPNPYGSEVLLHDFTLTHTDIGVGMNEGNWSRDDKYVAINAAKIGGGTEIIIMDIEDCHANPNQPSNIFSRMDIADNGEVELDWISVSQTGAYIVFQYQETSVGGARQVCYDNTAGAPSNPRVISDTSSHGDLGIDINGEDVMFQVRSSEDIGIDDYFLQFVRLRDGLEVLKFFDRPTPKGIHGMHGSCRNLDRDGWCYVSETCCATGTDNLSAGSGRTSTDVFAVRIDYTSNDIQWFCRTYAFRRFGALDVPSVVGYASYAVPNRKGTKVAFRSYWNDLSLIAQFPNYPPQWVCEWQQP